MSDPRTIPSEAECVAWWRREVVGLVDRAIKAGVMEEWSRKDGACVSCHSDSALPVEIDRADTSAPMLLFNVKLTAAIRRALDEQVEACAKVADAKAAEHALGGMAHHDARAATAKKIASDIRAILWQALKGGGA